MDADNPFIEKMERHSNEKLIYILTTDKDGFQPMALEAAKHVLDSRDIADDEKSKIEEQVKAREQKEREQKNGKPGSLLKGPGFLVTLFVIIPPMLLIKERGMGITFIIAAIGFGAGHAVNYYYFKNKKKSKIDNEDVLD